MPTFRTVMPVPEAPFRLSYPHKTLSLGSCFAIHIGERMKKYKFPIQNNPFGILYNPASILNGIKRLFSDQLYTPEDLFQQHDLWHHFDFHGSFSHFRREEALQAMNSALLQGRKNLSECQRLLLTFGTSYVFEYAGSKRIVANCHKVPAKHFRRYRLRIDDIVPAWINLLRQLKTQKPDLEVSPAHRLFVEQQLVRIKSLQEKYPFLSLSTRTILIIHHLLDLLRLPVVANSLKTNGYSRR
jgi:hypothetical protein